MSDKKIDKEDRDNPLPSKCLGIFNLSLETSEKDLHEMFFRYGEIEDVSLVIDKVSKRSRGFGFVYFKNIDDAEIAKEKVHGTIVQGKQIRVDYSVTLRAHTPTPGVYKGTKTTTHDFGRKPNKMRPNRRNPRDRLSERDRSEQRMDYSRYNNSDYDNRSGETFDRRGSRYEYSERRSRDWTDYPPRRRSPFNDRPHY